MFDRLSNQTLMRIAAGFSGAIIGPFVACIIADIIQLPPKQWVFYAVIAAGAIAGMTIAAKLTSRI